MPAELVTGRARIAARALRRVGVGAIGIAGIGAACFGGDLLIRPDADNPLLAAFVEGFNFDCSAACNATEAISFGRAEFLLLLLAGVWAACWSGRKLQGWHLLRKAGGNNCTTGVCEK
jgi:hypothetical protein